MLKTSSATVGSPQLKYKLLISYDGTGFSGWQIQQNGTSIQLHLEKALSSILRRPTSVTGAGRTDKGVHAIGQVAHFSCGLPVDLRRLIHSLNGLLPPDIRVYGIEKVATDFHARYSAKSKIYRYSISTAPVADPLRRFYVYHLPYKIDIDLIKKAIPLFLGKQNFASFSHEAHKGSASKNPIRTLKRLEMIVAGNEIILELEADGFLYKMVRNIVGTLLDLGRGKLSIEQIPPLFTLPDRRHAGATAPAHGLCLLQVVYPPETC